MPIRSLSFSVLILSVALATGGESTGTPPESPLDPEMVLVPGGCFEMGDTFGDGQPSERPAHMACVGDFYLATTEVTQALWRTVVGDLPPQFDDCEKCPVANVNWHQANYFIKRLNEMTSKRFRLPTEAEWEYAARGAGRRERWAGTNNEAGLTDYAWYSDNAGRRPHAVKQKTSNSLGLHDMSGNVWEWVEDWYGDSYYADSPAFNPTGPVFGDGKVMRGGSWAFPATGIRTTVRATSPPDHRFVDIGFRLAASVKADQHISMSGVPAGAAWRR